MDASGAWSGYRLPPNAAGNDASLLEEFGVAPDEAAAFKEYVACLWARHGSPQKKELAAWRAELAAAPAEASARAHLALRWDERMKHLDTRTQQAIVDRVVFACVYGKPNPKQEAKDG